METDLKVGQTDEKTYTHTSVGSPPGTVREVVGWELRLTVYRLKLVAGGSGALHVRTNM